MAKRIGSTPADKLVVISKADAKAKGMSRFFTGEPCKKGHIAERRVTAGSCWQCELDGSRARYAADPAKASAAAHARYIADPATHLARNSAWKKADPARAYASQLRSKAKKPEHYQQYDRAATAARMKANPEYYRTAVRNRNAKKKASGGKHTAAEIDALFATQKGKCVNCKTSLKSGYHADHIMPIALGGSNDIKNIQLLCAPCNRRKNAKDPIKWARENGRLL